METKQLATIVIVILTVTSIVGFTFLSGGHQPAQQPPTHQPPSQGTVLSFEAEDVEATVQRILPVLRIVGLTGEISITAIESKIAAIPGFKSFNHSSFQTSPDNQLLYFAEITAEPDDFDSIVSALTTISEIQSPEIVKKALVKVPKTVEVTNEQLSLTRDLTFAQPFSEAIVSFSTKKDDKIRIDLSIAVQDGQVVQSNAFETLNLTQNGLPHLTNSVKLVLGSLEKMLVFSTGFTYNGFDAEQLNNEIKKLSGVKNSTIKITINSPSFSVSYPQTSGFSLTDAETVFNELEFVEELGFQQFQEKNVVNISFSTDFSYSDVKQSISDVLEERNINDYSFADPLAGIIGETEINSENAVQVSEELKQLLSSYDVRGQVIRQKGKIFADSIIDPIGGNVYIVDENFVKALVLPGHSIGEEIDFRLTYYTRDDKVIHDQTQALENA